MIYHIGLGSNIGNLKQNLKNAISNITSTCDITLLSQSNLYTTKAWGYTDQPDFLNAVIKIETNYQPLDLLHVLQNIETQMGRVRNSKWGPRIIDIDILFCDDLIFQTSELTIPHPYAHERDFVLKPMCDIDPDYIHPILKKTMTKLLIIPLY